eukprot:Sspe_Gene.93377::Locus_66032_Transcript_1_1_Confidence_1.000_Length_462::g.93377::m.93377
MEADPTAPETVRVTSGGRIRNYVRFASTYLGGGAGRRVSLVSANHRSIDKVVTVAEILRRLHPTAIHAASLEASPDDPSMPQLSIAITSAPPPPETAPPKAVATKRSSSTAPPPKRKKRKVVGK